MTHTPSDQSISLNQLQRWMQAIVTHPAGIESALKSTSACDAIPSFMGHADEVVLRSSRLTSEERLKVYGNAYFARLLECLQTEFPAMVKALGEEAFNGLAFGYLIDRPSSSYTLSKLASDLPDYLSRTRPARQETDGAPDFADFLIDLATLERTYSEVFDGPGPEQSLTVHSHELNAMSPERFLTSHIEFHQSVRLLALQFPVHEFASAVRAGIDPDFPTARPTWLVITRRDFIVRRFEVTEMQFRLLQSLLRGDTIDHALRLVASDAATDNSKLAFDLQTWFQEWSAALLFKRIVTPD